MVPSARRHLSAEAFEPDPLRKPGRFRQRFGATPSSAPRADFVSSGAEQRSCALHLGRPASRTVGGKASLATPDGSGRRPAATPRGRNCAKRGARVRRARARHAGTSSAELRGRPRGRPGPRRRAGHCARPESSCHVLSTSACSTETPSRGIERRPRALVRLLLAGKRALLDVVHCWHCLFEVQLPGDRSHSSGGLGNRPRQPSAVTCACSARPLLRMLRSPGIGSFLPSKLTSGRP